jgi:hypothetical protein
LVGRRIVAEDPVDLGPVRVEEDDRRRGVDIELVEDGLAVRFLDGGLEEDEILGQEGLVFGVAVELLTEQFAAPSGVGVEV